MRAVLATSVVVALLTLPAGAQDEPYGDTYTADELAALDRALYAGNLDRGDLTFDKALTEGHGCLPLVRELLHDPLRIAPEMDGIVALQERLAADGLSPAVAALVSGATLLTDEARHAAPAPREIAIDGTSPESLAASLLELAARQPDYAGRFDAGVDVEQVMDALRARLPNAMVWHDVIASPFEGERAAAAQAWRKDDPAALNDAAARLGGAEAVTDWLVAFGDPGHWLGTLPAAAFPTEEALIVETPYGRIGLGTPGDDTWTGDFTVLVDPGGNDRYVGCGIGAASGTAGRRLGFFADLGGDDVYECAEVNVTLGAAILGVAAFYDLGAGNDRYSGGHVTLGAAIGGAAVFHDDGGSDVYEGRTYTQGAAAFGVAVFHDDAVHPAPATSSDEGTREPVDIASFDNDRLSAWANAQAFARPLSVALCINRRGNETYHAGGVYLHAPLFSDRYQSFSQGFAIGDRGIDWAGGVAMLIDHDGNDRYLGDIYDQGVGYWYGAGFLWDGGGNDTYEMTQYGQGSGIHLAIGGLVDVAGNDTYVMHSGLGQGGSHDYAASVLHDRGGNDRYHGSTSCNGCGLTNSVGLQIDRSGNDTYGARRKSGVNVGRPARDFPSIGILLDLAGQDDYLGVMTDDGVWRHTDIGVGVDVEHAERAPSAGAAATSGVDQVGDSVAIPEICSYEGELTQAVFDALWEIAVRWEVGDNRVIVPEARKRLVAFGAGALPLLDGKVEKDESGLELRAFVDVLRGIAEGGARVEVLAFVRRNCSEGNARRKRVALHLAGELKYAELEGDVVAILDGSDAALRRRAAGVLAQLGSRAGDAVLLRWLEGDDARARATAVATLLALRADVYPALRPHLASADFAVRGRLVTLLAKHIQVYGEAVAADLTREGASVRQVRSLLDVLARAAKSPPAGAADAVGVLLDHADPGVRGDAVRVVRAWQSASVDLAGLEELGAGVARRATDDPDPFVRDSAR